jgi:hypothetical protein
MAFSMVSTGWWDKLNMNRQMVASQSKEAVDAGVGGTVNAGYSFWNEDYTGFQHLGAAAAGVSSGSVNIALTAGLGFGLHHGGINLVKDRLSEIFQRPAAEYIDNVYQHKGVTYAKALNGGPAIPVGGATNTGINELRAFGQSEQRIAAIGKHTTMYGKKGVWRQPAGAAGIGEGAFTGRSLLMTGWGAGLSMAAFIGLPIMAGAAFGLAGRLLDEAHMGYQQSKYHHLDKRDFNNRQMMEWNMQKQGQMMDNMMPYENNMMSMARIYHSR